MDEVKQSYKSEDDIHKRRQYRSCRMKEILECYEDYCTRREKGEREDDVRLNNQLQNFLTSNLLQLTTWFPPNKELQTDLNTHGTKIDGAQFFIQIQKEDND